MNDQWRNAAACKGVDIDVFFPVRRKGLPAAKRICAACPVVASCLEDALRIPGPEDLGVRGGLSEHERRMIRRRARRKAAQPLAPVIPLAAPTAPAQPRRAA